MKRVIALLLTFAMLVSNMPLQILATEQLAESTEINTASTDETVDVTESTEETAGESSAVDSGTCGDNLNWTLNSNGLLTISGTGDMEDYDWGSSPFYNNTDITSVIIEDGVSSIGNCAFLECFNLTSVTIGGSVTSIGYNAFYVCERLESVTIPASVTSIALSAFEECYKLTGIWVDEENTAYCSDAYGVLFDKEMSQLLKAPSSLTGTYSVPEGVTTICERAFQYCRSLTAVVFPDSMESIGFMAFECCSKLLSVSIPASVTYIGCPAFYESCSQGIWVDEANTVYASDAFGVLFNKAMTRLFQVPSGIQGEYEIPESVKYIEDDAFLGCNSVTSVVMHDAVTEIGSYAFFGCSNLKTVTLSESLTEISSGMFFCCGNLESVTIPESVTRIATDAFSSCEALASVMIPAGVTTLENNAFGYCTGLAEITFAGGPPRIASYAFAGVNAVAYYPFYEDGWTSNMMQDYGGTLTWEPYGMLASGECGDALTWQLSESGKLMISGTGDMADYSAAAAPWSEYTVTNVIIKAGVTGISSGAFSGCTDLTEIVFEGDAPTIGETAFEGITAEAFYPEGNTTWTEDVMQNYGGTLTWTEKAKFSYPVIQADVETTAQVPSGGCAYFQFKPEFTETYYFCSVADGEDTYGVLFDSNMNVLAENDDNGSVDFGITYILEAGETYIFAARYLSNGSGSFPVLLQAQHEYTATVIVKEATCTEAGLKQHTCQSCGKTTEETYILDHTYGDDGICVSCGAEYSLSGTCGGSLAWTLNKDGLLTIYGAGDMDDYGWDRSPFAFNSNIVSVVIEEGVTSVGAQAFYHCNNLTSVVFPDSLTSIGSGVFFNCGNLTEIVFAGKAPEIDGEAFQDITVDAFYPKGDATWTEEVLQQYGGALNWIAYAQSGVSYAGMSLSLNGDIGVNFYVTLGEDLLADENLRMVFNMGGKTQEMALANAQVSTSESGIVRYRFSCSMPAKGMSDEVVAQLYGTDGAIGESKTYSVAAYYDDICEQFDREKKAELFALIEAMLNYGAASQEYFGYNTENLANAAVATAVPQEVDASAYAAVVSDRDKLLSYAGMSLVLESNTVLRVFFRSVSGADISGCTFTVNGQTVTPVQRGNLWYIELANIAAKDLDTDYTFTAGDVTVQCSALSYVNNVLNKAAALDEKLVAACKALYAYNEAANTYFQPSSSDIVTVNYYCSMGSSLDLLQEQIDQWNATEGAASGVNIQLISNIYAYSWDLDTLMNAGTHYDIIDAGSGNDNWKANGWVQDLNAIDNAELQALIASYEQFFTPGINTDPGPDGEYFLHSLPYDAVPLKMAVNLDLFEQAGVELPETWEDVVAAAEAISNLGDNIYGYGGTTWSVYYTRLHMLTAANSTKTYWDPNTETYSFSQYEEIVMSLQTMYENGWLGGLDDLAIDPIRAQFAAGNIGMFPSPSYDFAVYTSQYPAECNWAVIDMPKVSNGGNYKGVYLDRVGCAIDAVSYEAADAAKKEAIVKAFCFLNSDELASVLYSNGCIIPYKHEIIANTEVLLDHPQWAQYADIENYMPVPQVPDSVLSLEGDRIHDVINAIVHGALDWDTAIADAEARYNAAYQAAKENPDIDTSVYAYEYNH